MYTFAMHMYRMSYRTLPLQLAAQNRCCSLTADNHSGGSTSAAACSEGTTSDANIAKGSPEAISEEHIGINSS